MAQKANIPKDGNRIAAQLTPSVVALSQAVSSSISSSSTIAVTAGATFIRIYAISQDIYLKWGSTAVTSSNFDEVIPAGQICDFFIPVDSTGATYTTMRVIERTATATIIWIQK